MRHGRCGSVQETVQASIPETLGDGNDNDESNNDKDQTMGNKLQLTVGSSVFTVTPEDNATTWLTIYFFTLVGAYKYDWKVGLLTAVFSPVVKFLLLGMPMPEVLPAILLKSGWLAVSAGYASHRFRRIFIPILLGVVLCYQLAGPMGEWLMTGDFHVAVQDFRIGLPGMVLQVFGGYRVIKYLIYR